MNAIRSLAEHPAVESFKSHPAVLAAVNHPIVQETINHRYVLSYTDFVVGHRVLGFLATSFVLSILTFLWVAIYRLYFHPLAKYPGPKLAAISDIWFGYVSVTGQSIHIIKDAHDKYGPILRIAPNDLSFATAQSLTDIYGRSAKRKFFPKTDFYDAIAFGFDETGLATERDPKVHKRKRNFLAPVFSYQALKDFEELMQFHFNKFIREMEKRGATQEGMDLTDWFQFVTFDLTGDLAFGEPFGAMDDAASHFWMSLIIDNIDIGAYAESIRRYPIVNWFVEKCLPKRIKDARTYHVEWSKEKTHRRIFNPANPDRKDMMTYLLNQSEAKGVTHDEITSHAAQIILGGSETVATFCTFCIYHLLREPRTLALLTQELRTTFSDIQQITSDTTANLPYLNAAIREGLRITPPGPTGLPRYSPGETVDGSFIPMGTRVSTHPWTVNRTERYWDSPAVFRPERWLDPDNADVKEASLPFQTGPRACIGQNLAWIQMRLFLGQLFYLFDIELVDPEEDWLNKCKAYMLWSKAPLFVRAKRQPAAMNDVLST